MSEYKMLKLGAKSSRRLYTCITSVRVATSSYGENTISGSWTTSIRGRRNRRGPRGAAAFTRGS
jgi:hypothetical protein